MPWRQPTYRPTAWRNLRPPRAGLWPCAGGTPLFTPTSRCSMTPLSGRLTQWKTTGAGASRTFPIGSGMPAFEYRQAEEVRDVFARYGVRYLFIGKSGAILLGFQIGRASCRERVQIS